MSKPVVVSQPYSVTVGEIVQPSGELAKYGKQGADIPSAATTDLASATGDYVRVTGTANITSFGVAAAGLIRTVEFTGACHLIYNSTSMILPSAQTITTAPFDTGIFRSRGSGNWICVSYQAASGASTMGLTPADVGLGNVENVALSTWPGSTNLRILGTVNTGTWAATSVAVNKGGTGQTSVAQGDMLFADATNSFGRLPKSAVKSRYLSNQGGLDNSPIWGQVDLTTGVTGVLPPLNGGVGAAAQTIPSPTGIAVSIDLSLGNMCLMSVASATGNLSVSFTNPTPGLLNYLFVTQGSTQRQLTFPAGTKQPLWGGNAWGSSGALKTDIITFVYSGAIYYILGTSPDVF